MLPQANKKPKKKMNIYIIQHHSHSTVLYRLNIYQIGLQCNIYHLSHYMQILAENRKKWTQYYIHTKCHTLTVSALLFALANGRLHLYT